MSSLRKYARPQTLLSSVFVGLGAWCIVHPSSVMTFCVRPEFREAARNSSVTVLFCQCFGAQAVLTGMSLSMGKLSARSYKIFAAATVPFWVVDYWYSVVDPVTTVTGGVIDAVGNLFIVAACLWGIKDAEAEENAGKRLKDN